MVNTGVDGWCRRTQVLGFARPGPPKVPGRMRTGFAFNLSPPPGATSWSRATISTMGYAVKELFFTLQGEGAHTGRAAVFCRFAGCNLWNGREADRASATCSFCDTDFVGLDGPGGGRYASAEQLAAAAAARWPGGRPTPAEGAWLVCTGGEPTLQLDAALVAAFRRAGFAVAVETNGTRPVPAGLDWVCVSPKAGAVLRQRSGDELKVVFPQPGLDLDALTGLDFANFSVQPMDGAAVTANTAAAVRYCLEHPPWRLSLQTHKLLGLP